MRGSIHRLLPLFIVVSFVIASVGCLSGLSPLTVSPASVADPGGVLTVPRTNLRGGRVVVVSNRSAIPLALAPATGKHSARDTLFARGSSDSHWQALPLEPTIGVPTIRAEIDGEYLIAAAPADSSAAALEQAIVLRLRVDHAPPVLTFKRSFFSAQPPHDQDGVEFAWQCADDSPLAGPIRLEYSANAGEQWRPLENALGNAGRFRWSLPPAPRADHWLRFTAQDLAGNRQSTVVPLLESAATESTHDPPPASERSTDDIGNAAAHDPRDAEAVVARSASPAEETIVLVAPEFEQEPALESILHSAQPDSTQPAAAETGAVPLNFSGDLFAGGSTHNLYIGGRDRTGVHSSISLRLVPSAGGEAIQLTTVPRDLIGALIEVPRASGEFWLEIAWKDAAGGDHTRRPELPLTIDAEPPRIAWGPVLDRASDSATLSLEAPGDTPASLAELAILFRREPSAEWTRLRFTGSEIRHEPPSRLLVQFPVGTLAEGEWLLAAEARDVAGNATASPVAGPSICIDRTPIDLARLRIPSIDTEGVPFFLALEGAEVPADSSADFLPAGGDLVLRPIGWVRDEGFWRGEVEGLPAGAGQLLVRVEDEFGNRSERRAELEIQPAITRAALSPPPPHAAGAPLWLSYDLRSPHPRASAPIIAEIFPAGGALATEALDSAVLSEREGRVCLHAPRQPGHYRISFSCGGTPLSTQMEIRVSAGRDVAGPRSTGRETEIVAAAFSDGRPSVSTALILGRFRALAARFAAGERAPELERDRGLLVREFEEALARAGGDDAVRRALAQLHVYAAPPDYARAAACLLERPAGVESARDTSGAELLNDLAAIELRLGKLDDAERHVLLALAQGETALRRYNLGEVHLMRRRFADAEQCFRAALESGPRRRNFIESWLQAVARLSRAEIDAAAGRLHEWVDKKIVSAQEALDLERVVARFAAAAK